MSSPAVGRIGRHGGAAGIRARASARFPGGVNSPVRAFASAGRDPLVLASGEGAYVRDADGVRYLDLVSSWGATILGHAHPRVTAAVREAAARGMALGMTHPLEVDLGDAISAAMPAIEQLRFVSSGTEAVMSALRVARAATGRDLVVKTTGAYHGHADGMLVEAGSGLATLALPGSAGVPADVAAGTVVVPFNDAAAVELALVEHRGRVAAVIVEPIVANSGVIAPAAGYLEALRSATAAHGALLIFDEVITGFRVGRGGAQARFGVEPDLTTLGKIIGGGMSIGAYGGRRALMQLVAPAGPVYQAGTLSGHPLAMAAGLATLAELDDSAYRSLDDRARRLAEGLLTLIARHGRTASVGREGPLLTLFFRSPAPVDAEEATAGDVGAWRTFFGRMLDQGVLLPPSPFEAWFPGLAHGEAEIELLLDAADHALAG